MALEQSIHGDDHHAVHGDDGKGGKAHLEHPAHDRKAGAGQNQRHSGFFHQKIQHKNSAGALTDNGSQRCAAHTHIKHENKQRIQHNIKYRTHHHRQHTRPGIALGDDELVHAGGQQGKHRAADIDGEIAVGIGIGDGAGTKQPQHGAFQRKCQSGDSQCNGAQQQKAVAHNAGGLFFPPLSQTDAHQRRTAHTHQKGKSAHHGDDGAANAHTSQ